MKKLFFTITALCAFTATTFAQTPDPKLGAKAGLNLANISGVTGTEMKMGFNVGVLAEVFITEKFSVQPEVLYSTQGYKIPIIGSTTAISNLDYVNIPIIAKYYIFEGLNIQAGPQVGFLVKETSKGTAGELSVTSKTKTSNTVDFGLGFGLGYELPMGVFIDARYNLGLTNVSKEKYNPNKTSNKHQVIQFSLGFKF